MRKRTVAALVVAVSLLILPAPDADAVPGLCEHRGMDHIDRHGGKLADDAWHRDHHEQVTCDADGKDHRGDDHPEEPASQPKADDARDRRSDDRQHDGHDEIQRHDEHNDHCIGRCNRDHAWWH